MKAPRPILIFCLGFFLFACAATPELKNKSGLSRAIKQKAPVVNRVDISPDGRYVLSGGFDAFVMWDILQGKKIQTFSHPKAFVGDTTPVAFSPNDKYFASGGTGAKLWDMATHREKIEFNQDRTFFLSFSPDGKQLLTGGPAAGLLVNKPPNMKIFDVATGRQIQNFDLKGHFVWSGVFYPDARHIVTGGSQGEIRLWDATTGRVVRSVKGSDGLMDPRVNVVALASDGDYLVTGGSDNSTRIWDAKTLSPLKKFVGHERIGGVMSAAFSPDGRYAVSGGNEGRVVIWDLAAGTQWKVLSVHADWVAGASAKFTPDGKYVLSAGDASTRLWDAATGEEIASMIAFEDGEWIITTSNGYYASSPKGDQYLQVKVAGKEYDTEQLRESFYRPDLVRLALSGGSLKDLKKVADVKPPPQVVIVETPQNVGRNEVTVTLQITDAGGGVGDIRLYLNGSAVMLDHARGVSVVSKTQGEIRKSYALKLVHGINVVKAVAFNADNTMQSSEAVHEIAAAFKTESKPSLSALIIGINAYKNPKLQLNFAAADAQLFARTLRESAAPLFEKTTIKMLSTQEETTRGNILQELQAMKSLNPDDLFVFYVASHGTVDEGEYFLITSNVGSLRTEKLKTDAISQNTLKELIANIPSTKKLIIIDTCNAGKLGDVIQTAMLTRGMSEDTAFKILSRAVGSTILSASTSLQEALEGYQGHGLFTYVLAEGLNGKADKGNTGYVRTTELADYVDNEVPALAEKIFKRAQYPTISISGQAFPVGKVK
jgi:WD40 repeat protein